MVVLIGAKDRQIETFQRSGFFEVERLPLGQSLDNIGNDDIAQFLFRAILGHRSPNVTRADTRYFEPLAC